uniref:Uncharacterized protein n=1 Tax=Rhizophora mucronata TaxID=61149 RepID=A0A2P2PUA3_RHIMU
MFLRVSGGASGIYFLVGNLVAEFSWTFNSASKNNRMDFIVLYY